jgi:hypothetical protein
MENLIIKYLSGLVAPIWIIVFLFTIYIIEQAIKVFVAWRTYKRQVIFANLHEKRAFVIGDMYQKMKYFYSNLQFFTRVGILTDGSKTEEEVRNSLYDALEKSYVETKNYFELNRVYIPEELCDKIDNLIRKMSYCAIDYSFLDKDIRKSVKGRNTDSLEEKLKQCKDVREKVDNELLELLSQLEAEFRTLLGEKKVATVRFWNKTKK